LLKDGFVVNTILKEADLFCPNSVRINFTIYHNKAIIAERIAITMIKLVIIKLIMNRLLIKLTEYQFPKLKSCIVAW
ncbi:hypothetical protein EFN62_09045, partial [Pediococcus parvulus]|nr:hypothetical protein [Pediococcus parvulus]